MVNGEPMRVDSSRPNPSGVEVDNLYLDMNGIIHPCCHPEDREQPATELEMFEAIFACVNQQHCFFLTTNRPLSFCGHFESNMVVHEECMPKGCV